MFSVNGMQTFTFFSMPHILTLILFFLTIFLFVYYWKKLKSYKNLIRWTLFTILIVCEVSFHLWLVLTNQWEVADLPLQLCSLSTFLYPIFIFETQPKSV
jgi:hypothetical protein